MHLITGLHRDARRTLVWAVVPRGGNVIDLYILGTVLKQKSEVLLWYSGDSSWRFLPILNWLNHAGLAKKMIFCKKLYYVWFFCSINFCFSPFEFASFNTKCDDLKIYWGSPQECSYLRNAYYVIIFCCFAHAFVDSACKQLTMALSQARILLRPNSSLGNLMCDMSFFQQIS